MTNDEMREIADKLVAMQQPVKVLQLDVSYAAPRKIVDGQIVLADGTTWNPGGGAGVYARISGAWVKL